MKHFFSCLLIAIITFNAQAQRNFKPGYVVTMSGDTTKGLIDYKDWLQNPRLVDFKTSENAAVVQYSATRIKAFGVNNLDYYISYNGPVTTGVVQLPDLSVGINRSKITDTIFLRTVIAGSKVALYSYNDLIKNRFFIAETNLKPAELERYVYRDNANNSNIVESNIYQEQLKLLADKYQPGNAGLANRIQRATYQPREVEKIVSAINGLSEVTKLKVAKREGIAFFLGASANLSQAAFKGDTYGLNEGLFVSGIKNQSIGPAFNGGLDYYFNKNSGNFIFRMELSFSINKISGTYSQPYVDNVRVFTRTETFSPTQLKVSLNPQFVYNLVNNSKLKFYLAGGIQLNKTSGSDRYYYIDFYENNALNKRNEREIAFRGLYITPTAKAGVILPKVAEIYLGYSPPAEILNDSVISTTLSTFSLGVNYRFGIK